MAKEKIVIELTEKDLSEIIAKHYDLQTDKTQVKIIQHKASDQRETDYTEIIVTSDYIRKTNNQPQFR